MLRARTASLCAPSTLLGCSSRLAAVHARVAMSTPTRRDQSGVARPSGPSTPPGRGASTMAGTERVSFASFDVTDQVFYRSPLVVGIVNLKPIVPGHVLMIPRRPCSRLAQLEPAEVAALFQAATRVGARLEEALGADALTVSVQDGAAAGQSVPHVHVHVLPRKAGDFTPNDEIYNHLESFGFSLAQLHKDRANCSSAEEAGERSGLRVDADEARRPRSGAEMRREAEWLMSLVEGC